MFLSSCCCFGSVRGLQKPLCRPVEAHARVGLRSRPSAAVSSARATIASTQWCLPQLVQAKRTELPKSQTSMASNESLADSQALTLTTAKADVLQPSWCASASRPFARQSTLTALLKELAATCSLLKSLDARTAYRSQITAEPWSRLM